MWGLAGRHVRHVQLYPAGVTLHLIPQPPQARAIASLHGMTARELCNTLWALSVMDRMSSCTWRRVTQWLENKSLEQLRPQHLTRAYQAQLLAHTHEVWW